MSIEFPHHENKTADASPSRNTLKDVLRTVHTEQDSAQRPLEHRPKPTDLPGAKSPELTSVFESVEPESPKGSVLKLARDALRLKKKTESEIYEHAHYAEMAKRPLEEKDVPAFFKALSDLSEKHDKKVKSHPQNSDHSTHEFLKQHPEGRDSDRRIGFYFALSRDKSSSPISARLSVRLEPDQAVAVFKYVTEELVIKHHLVKSAKLASPYHIDERDDSMVIYLSERNEKEASQIVQNMTDIFSRRCFGSHVPVGEKMMAPGIGYAEQGTSEKSRSTLITEAIEDAIQQYDEHVSKLSEAQRSISENLQRKYEEEFLPQALEKHGIDPNEPYKTISQP